MPQEIEALAVILLGNDLRSLQSMEASVQGISSRFHNWDRSATSARISELAARIDAIRREEAELRGKLREARRSDTLRHEARPGGYQGTTQTIAERLRSEADRLGWIGGEVGDGAVPLTDAEARELLGLLRSVGEFDGLSDRARLVDLAGVPTFNEFEALVRAEHGARARLTNAIASKPDRLVGLGELNRDACRIAEGSLESLVSQVERFRAHSDSWIAGAVEDVLLDRDGTWKAIRDATARAVEAIGTLAEVTSNYRLTGVDAFDRQVLKGQAISLLAHLDAGKRHGMPLLRPRPIKEGRRLMTEVRVNGRLCDRPEVLRELLAWMHVVDNLDYLDHVWSPIRQGSPEGSPLSARLAHFEDLLRRLNSVLAIREARQAAERATGAVAGLSVPSWATCPRF